MDTPEKSSPVVFPQITDKSSPLELTKPSNYGTLLPNVNSPVKLLTTLNGYHVLDIPLSSKLNPKLHSNHISHLSDGMEDLKFGTLTSKLDLLLDLMTDLLTLFLSPLTLNILLLEEEINKSISGMLPILKNQSELSKLDQSSTPSNSTLNYNGSLLLLNQELKFGIWDKITKNQSLI